MKKRTHKRSDCIAYILLALLMVPALSAKSYSQVPNKAETLAYLNKLGGDTLRFSLKNTLLTVGLFTAAGNLVREDKVLAADLDTVGKFETNSGLFYVNCLSGYQGCVTRTLVIQKIKRQYDRISFPVNESSGAPLQTALQHLIKILSVKNYHDEVSLPPL